MIKFVDLHAHSTYSEKDAHPLPIEMVKRAKEIGRDSLALTDHGTISGWVQFDKACKDNGIKNLFGIESYIVPDIEKMREDKIREKSHITILAQNEKGYRNILKLASLGFSEGFYYRSTLDSKMLFEHQEGLIVLSGCWTGFVQKALRENNIEEAKRIAQEYKSVFGNRYYLETQHFPLFKDTINGLEYVSAQLDIPIVLTCDPHYLTADQAEVQEILHAIRDRRTFDANQIIYGAYQWPAEELFEAVKTLSPSSPWEKYFENTYNVPQRIDVIQMIKGGSPKYNIDNSYELLKQWSLEGFIRLGIKNEGIYKERFEKELDVIAKYGFCDYILVIADIVKWAKSQNIYTGPGRGSSAGSLICYLTGITTVDPIKHDLLFERFLQEGRKEPPDIDVDFDMDRRDDVKEYISSKYGKDNVCNIGTFGFFKGRSALDDIRRIYELPTEEINFIKPEIPEYNESDERSNSTISEMFKSSDKAKELLKKYPMLKKAEYIDGHIRQMGEHASGVVISNIPLTDIIAIYEREKDKKVTQFSCFDMNDSADLGLLKVDILGITELTIISDICKLIGMSLDDLYKIPIDDKETLLGFRKIDTDGIFQFSGYATKKVLQGFRNLTSFDQLVATVALSRPGPVNSKMTEKYISGANGFKDNSYTWHPILKEIIKDTYNTIVYQEQIMFICNRLAGMNWSDTDKIRKLMGKKYGDEDFEKWFIQFKDGCAKNGVTEEQARKLWDDIKKFGGYAFNKAHAVCYALVAFWGMYMKQHYPIQYYWARLSKEKDEEKIKAIAQGAKRKGLNVLKPRLGKSDMYWKIEDDKTLRAGLTYLKGIGEKAAEGLIKGNYLTEKDFETKKYRAVTKRTFEILKEKDAFVKIEV